MHKDGKIGMDGLDTSGGFNSAAARVGRPVIDHGNCMKSMSRSKYRGPAYLGGKHAKMAGLLIVFVAAAVVVSAAALVPSADGEAMKIPDKATARARVPPPPYLLSGLTMDSVGAMLFGVDINITNLRTGAYNHTVSYDYGGFGYAYYEFNLHDMDGGYPEVDGDIIRVTATYTDMEGQNQSALSVSGGYMMMDITLNPVVIPEFPMVVLPVVGLLAMVVAVSLGRRLEET